MLAMGWFGMVALGMRRTSASGGDQVNRVGAEADTLPGAPRTKSAVVVTGDVLAFRYQQNEVAADASYKNRFVELADVTVVEISKDVADEPYLVLRSVQGVILRAQLRKGVAEKAARLLPGMSLAGLTCRVNGLVLGVLSLDECG
jgi:hypothetical protein